jgi:uncharacterized membrane protein required for colicin V production
MTVVILVFMFFMAINSRNRGVVNYKFTIEITVLTILGMPPIATLLKEKLSDFVPEMLASIIGVVLGLMIVFLVLTYILGKIAKIPEYEYTSTDKMLGFFTGLIKGFCIMAFLIFLYGITFIDIIAPEILNMNFKQNFVNSKIENSIEYYRSSIYKVYIRMKGAGVESLYQKGEKVLDFSGYVSWTGDTVIPNKVIKLKSERRDKPGQPLPEIQ